MSLWGDDYGIEEFTCLRNRFHVGAFGGLGLARRSTTDSQRLLLENAFARSCFPSKHEVSRLCRALGVGWSRDRVLKWFANKRAFPNRCRRNKRSTTDEQRRILEAAFSSIPEADFPGKVDKLGEVLNWSKARVLKWFQNKKNYRARNPKRSRSEYQGDMADRDAFYDDQALQADSDGPSETSESAPTSPRSGSL